MAMVVVAPMLAATPWPGVAAAVAAGVIAAARVAKRVKPRSTSRKGPVGPPVVPDHPVIDPPPLPRGRVLSEIEFVRRNLGPVPRVFDRSLAGYLHIDSPPWLRKSPADQMSAVYTAQDRLRRDGTVVWAALVQANALLFSPGPIDSPASVVWSDDPYYDDHPNELLRLGSSLFAVKGTRQADPGLAEFSRMLANERDRAHGLQVPESVTGGRIVYHSSIMCVRKHLPHGYVSGGVFPVWIDAEPTGLVLLVPAAFWSAGLMARW